MKFLLKYFFHLLFISSVIILIFVIYRSEIQFEGLKRDYYQVLYYQLFIFSLVSVVGIFLPKIFKLYAMIIITSLIITLYLFEFFLTNYGNLSKREIKERITKFKELTGEDFDTRTKIEIFEELNAKNRNYKTNIIWPAFFKSNNKYKNINKNKIENFYPLSGFSNSKIIHCNENGYYSIYLSDRYGFNNPDYEWNKKEIDFLLVGDSFIHGACVNRPHDIASVLRTLSGKSVINLGQDSTGPLQSFARLREYLQPNVKNILWFHSETNDFQDLSREIEVRLLKKYVEDKNFNQNLINKQNTVNNISQEFLDFVFKIEKKNQIKNKGNFDALNFVKLFKVRMFLYNIFFHNDINVTPSRNTKETFINIIKQTQELAKKNGSNLYFIHLPDAHRYKKRNMYEYTDKIIVETLNMLNVEYINLNNDLFQKEKNPLDLFSFGQMNIHYNKKGYKKVAERINSILN